MRSPTCAGEARVTRGAAPPSRAPARLREPLPAPPALSCPRPARARRPHRVAPAIASRRSRGARDGRTAGEGGIARGGSRPNGPPLTPPQPLPPRGREGVIPAAARIRTRRRARRRFTQGKAPQGAARPGGIEWGAFLAGGRRPRRAGSQERTRGRELSRGRAGPRKNERCRRNAGATGPRGAPPRARRGRGGAAGSCRGGLEGRVGLVGPAPARPRAPKGDAGSRFGAARRRAFIWGEQWLWGGYWGAGGALQAGERVAGGRSFLAWECGGLSAAASGVPYAAAACGAQRARRGRRPLRARPAGFAVLGRSEKGPPAGGGPQAV
jgi:hypothetical protein